MITITFQSSQFKSSSLQIKVQSPEEEPGHGEGGGVGDGAGVGQGDGQVGVAVAVVVLGLLVSTAISLVMAVTHMAAVVAAWRVNLEAFLSRYVHCTCKIIVLPCCFVFPESKVNFSIGEGRQSAVVLELLVTEL